MADLRLYDYGKLVPGRLLGRRQRFLADVLLDDGETVVAHCPNTGSMRGLLNKGAPVMLSPAADPDRKTRFTWELVRAGRVWVAVNTGLTNLFAERAVRAGLLDRQFGSPVSLRREVGLGDSRIDLLIHGRRLRTWVEVKSVTMCDRGRAAFPDAVTARGLKHLRCLVRGLRNGDRSAMLFLVQRADGRSFEPAAAIDPAYAEGLRGAADAGVKIVAAVLETRPGGVVWKRRIPVRL